LGGGGGGGLCRRGCGLVLGLAGPIPEDQLSRRNTLRRKSGDVSEAMMKIT